MEAIVVAGGLGTRLRPLTDDRPKHLLPVGGVPFLAHQIGKLAQSGVDRVVLATSYHADAFEPTFGDGSAYGVALVYVTETELLGTAGALRNVTGALTAGPDDPVLVLNGDILSGHDIAAQVKRHEQADADVTLHLVDVADARAYGCVPTDPDGRVLAFMEKSPDPATHQVNAGCYVFRRHLLDEIPAGRPVSVERETFPALLRRGARLIGHRDPAYWLDVGTPSALVQASCDLVRGIATSPAYPFAPAEQWLDDTAQVHETAQVTGGSAVGPGATVAEGAVVQGSVLMAGAVVGAGAVVAGSVVADGGQVGEHARLEHAVVI
ncbi:MAG: NTP transferase domain-containing protein [Propionibacteriales bacterium]|nr:NTP transferase domain-containing protein [Propionibacteriales bacterium]